MIPMRSIPSHSGFTLLELLVAVAILGIVMSTVYGVLTRTLLATKRAEARAELFASGREMVMRMADEIEGALPPTRQVYFVGERRQGVLDVVHVLLGNARLPAVLHHRVEQAQHPALQDVRSREILGVSYEIEYPLDSLNRPNSKICRSVYLYSASLICRFSTWRLFSPYQSTSN